MSSFCEDRVCIVTGGARGIGREHCLMLAEHGAKVVINDLGGTRTGEGSDLGPAEQVAEEIKSKGGEAVANGDDVSSFEGAGRMVQQAIDEFGRLDVLVNNAGILRDRMLVNMDEAEWDAVIAVHLKGTFAPARHAAAYWREQSKAGNPVDGRLINTSSVSGIYGNAGQTNYGAAKAGIAAFTIIAARELRRYGVTVNCVAPGALTRMTEDLGPGDLSDEQKAQRSPRWIAPIVTWLASAESSDVTGRVFEASGRMLAVAESWHRGPTVEAVDDPTQIGEVARDLVKRARKNAGRVHPASHWCAGRTRRGARPHLRRRFARDLPVQPGRHRVASADPASRSAREPDRDRACRGVRGLLRVPRHDGARPGAAVARGGHELARLSVLHHGAARGLAGESTGAGGPASRGACRGYRRAEVDDPGRDRARRCVVASRRDGAGRGHGLLAARARVLGVAHRPRRAVSAADHPRGHPLVPAQRPATP
jgi:NAD(P)-dependent dehydrogenase (short-subunit alcohol dehydrogenase family)